MGLLLLSLLGGALTVLSPCVLPLLPIILAGSLTDTSKRRPLIIVASLTISIVVFTLLLKLSTSFIFIGPEVWQTLSGGILILLGAFTLFPHAWDSIMTQLGIERFTQRVLTASTHKSNWFGPLLIGASLGPVFSSCSPTYALILATVLPQTFALGLLNLTAYAAGLAGVLLIIALFGQRAVKRMRFASNPEGWFRRGLGILFIVVGLLIFTGLDKTIETSLVARGLGITSLEQNLVDQINGDTASQDRVDTTFMNIKNPKAAPELRGLTYWINSTPLTLASLKGKVVLIDFWTYSCINCLRTLPTLKSWYQEYSDDGFVIIGVHAPEFAFEHVPSNVQKAVTEYGITYPVALDNDFSTWRAYSNRYWPAKYFIDREGRLRHTHFGEGDEAESEAVIRKLLTENAGITLSGESVSTNSAAPVSRAQTPETYLGYGRADLFDNEKQHVKDSVVTYSLDTEPKSDHWGLSGAWTSSEEKVTSEDNGSRLTLRFSAKSVYLVIAPESPADLTLKLNGVAVTNNQAGADMVENTLHVEADRLYQLIELPQFASDQLLEITVPKGTSLHAFTFGS